MIAFLLPSRSRPERCRAAIQAIGDVTPRPYQLILGTDADDPDAGRYAELCEPLCDAHVVFEHRTPPGRAANAMLQHLHPDVDVLFPFADDMHIHTPDWTDILKRMVPDDGLWVVAPWDGIDWMPTVMIFARLWVQHVGYVCPPHIEHQYGDTWIGDIAIRAGQFVRAPQIYVEHQHPLRGYPSDELYDYQRRSDGGVIEADRQRYMQGAGRRQELAVRLMREAERLSRGRYGVTARKSTGTDTQGIKPPSAPPPAGNAP